MSGDWCTPSSHSSVLAACPNTGHRETGHLPVLPQKMPDVVSSCLYLALSQPLSPLPSLTLPSPLLPSSPLPLVLSPPLPSPFLLVVYGHICEHVYISMCVQGDHINTGTF